MREAEGCPEIADGELGVRVRDDAGDFPEGTSVVRPNAGGMSATPADPYRMPDHRRPWALGGTSKKPCWELRASELPETLAFWQDKDWHGVIGASRELSLADFRTALARTRCSWRRVY